MTRAEIERMIQGFEEWDRCIVLFPVEDQAGWRWMGMSMGACVAFLSKVAAEFVTKHLPAAPERH